MEFVQANDSSHRFALEVVPDIVESFEATGHAMQQQPPGNWRGKFDATKHLCSPYKRWLLVKKYLLLVICRPANSDRLWRFDYSSLRTGPHNASTEQCGQ